MSVSDSGETQSAVEELLAREAIRRCKYRYVRCLDLKKWDDLRATLTPDATAAYSGGGYSFGSPDEMLAFLEENMGSENFLSSHRVGQDEIEFTSATEATAVWALDDVVIRDDLGITIRGAAFYEDEYRLADGEWRIARTTYRRVYEEIFPRTGIEGLELTASWWGTDGRSQLAP